MSTMQNNAQLEVERHHLIGYLSTCSEGLCMFLAKWMDKMCGRLMIGFRYGAVRRV